MQEKSTEKNHGKPPIKISSYYMKSEKYSISFLQICWTNFCKTKGFFTDRQNSTEDLTGTV